MVRDCTRHPLHSDISRPQFIGHQFILTTTQRISVCVNSFIVENMTLNSTLSFLKNKFCYGVELKWFVEPLMVITILCHICRRNLGAGFVLWWNLGPQIKFQWMYICTLITFLLVNVIFVFILLLSVFKFYIYFFQLSCKQLLKNIMYKNKTPFYY